MSAPPIDLNAALLSSVMLFVPTLQTSITHMALEDDGAVNVVVVEDVTTPAEEILLIEPQASAAMVPAAAMV